MRLPAHNFEIPIGVITEPTERGARGRWFDSDKIRFRKGLPEKLGGWILASLGSTDGDILTDEALTDFNGVSANYGGAATVLTMDSAITVFDGDPVILFGDSKTGGLGTRSVASGGADGSYLPVLDAVVTAALGDVVMFEMVEEYGGTPASIVSLGLAGDKTIQVDTAITTYLKAGTMITIALQAGGFHHTTFESALMSGAVVVTLKEALPSDATLASSVQIWAAGSEYIDFANSMSYILRNLGHAVAASSQLILTTPLPANVGTAPVDIRPYQQVAADGDQVASGTLTVTPPTAFAITSNTPFPNGFVILPAFAQDQICYEGFSRGVHDWSDLTDQQWAAIGTDVKLYVVNEGTLFDITPIRETGSLTSPFDTTALSVVVVVNDIAHGAQIGDRVRFSGASAVGGITIDGEYEIMLIIDADSYEIDAAFPALTTVAGGGGAVSYEYDIAVGPASGGTVQGYGTGPYGGGPYGIGQAGFGIETPLRIWSLDNFGEDLLASPNGGGLYHWDRSAGPTIRAVVVPTAPATIQRMLVSPQARHVICFGAGTGSFDFPGDTDKLFIRWASQEDFTDWIPSSTNNAGDLRLDVGSQIITAIESRGDIITFTDESLHALNYLGGEFVFGLRHLGQSVSIISPNAAIDQNGIVQFMAEDDFMVYDGVLRVMPCEVRNTVFNDLNNSQGDKVFCSVNKSFTEVWWFYPSLASEVNDRYVKYNYVEKAWDFGTIERTAFHDSSRFLTKPYGLFDGKIFQHETGVDETDKDGVLQPMNSFLESGKQNIDESGEMIMHIGGMVPDFKTLVGSVDITLEGRGYPQRATVVTKGPFNVISTTERFNPRIRSRAISIRVASSDLGDSWRMGIWRVEARPHGKRGG